jgi:hypothetical protein
MGEGPRDWNPPGYWDESDRPVLRPTRSTSRVQTSAKKSDLVGLLSVGLGLLAFLTSLVHWSNAYGATGFLFSTAGVSAIMLGIRAASLRRIGRAASRVFPVLGIVLGSLASVIFCWNLAAFYFPDTVIAAPGVYSVGSQVQTQTAALSDVPKNLGRIVAPVAGADITSPGLQLEANERHVAIGLCSPLELMASQHTLPDILFVGTNGIVYSTTTTFSSLPDYMSLNYAKTSGADTFTLSVADRQSGLSVTCDSSLRIFVSG